MACTLSGGDHWYISSRCNRNSSATSGPVRSSSTIRKASGSRMLVRLALAHPHSAFEPGAELGVIGFEERTFIARAGVPADLAADRLMHRRHCLRPILAQHPFERLQF